MISFRIFGTRTPREDARTTRAISSPSVNGDRGHPNDTMLMNIKTVDPTEIPDWDSQILQTGKIDFFHSSSWAKVLKESYRYSPLYYACYENGRLILSLPLMEVRSLLTGRRGCSLPFTDQCVPFFLDRKVLRESIDRCVEYGKQAGWKYIDLRATDYFMDAPPAVWSEYYDHVISLSRDESELFSKLAPSNRRNIKKAAHEALSVDISKTWGELLSFCRLNNLTRKRHGLPPQPEYFFTKLFEHVISPGHGVIISARYGKKVIASSIYLHFGKRAVFKYGASALSHLNLRPNNLIMWEAIKWYKDRQFETLSLGRTELDNPGLLRYKRTWGAEERLIRYFRYDLKKDRYLKQQPGKAAYIRILTRLPVWTLRIMGRLAYRHMG